MLLVFFSLLFLHLLGCLVGMTEPDSVSCDMDKDVLVQISGDIAHPGIYEFARPPDMKALVKRAGGLSSNKQGRLPCTRTSYPSGTRVDIRDGRGGVCVYVGEMSAFYKVTFGIPISLNRETAEGLTAIPGIGPKIAGAIVCERTKRGRFSRLNDVLSVPGVGSTLYKRLRPFLVL